MGVIDNEKQRIISSEKQSNDSEEVDSDEKKRGCKDVLRSVGRYFWDSETKEFLGRTGKSWGKLLHFKSTTFSLLSLLLHDMIIWSLDNN